MATLALSVAGAAAGSSLLPAGVSAFGASLSGAAIGQAAGAIARQYIDQAIFGSSGQVAPVEGPRLNDLQVMSSREGAPIPRLYGRARLSGQVIWAPDFQEEVVRVAEASSGGKATSRASAATPEQIEYRYYANFAVGLCEGEITRVGRVWADGQEIDLSLYANRVYRGTDTQQPDSLISAHEGEPYTPAFRGLAYIVFERFPLAEFGNRLPQLSFEVFRSISGLEDQIQAITLIPGAGETAYAPYEIGRVAGGGFYVAENRHTGLGGTDWSVSLDDLQQTCPSLKRVSLIVSWFGTDLRAGHCRVEPRVEISDKQTTPTTWSVSGVSRNAAQVVSQIDGRPAYGGTPSDVSVVRAIQDLKARGLEVTLYPFILMDVTEENSLPDPYGADVQPTFPWRGRITVDPAPGLEGTVDQTSLAAAQVASFVGQAAVNDFAPQSTDDTVTFNGGNESSFRRMILHYAHLAELAGGVDAFLIGSEMRGLTSVRQSVDQFPFVNALVSLAQDVRQVLRSSTKVSYAADWSEALSYSPSDGSGDHFFHLDPLWASNSIDAVAIDFYLPLSDWREGESHLDALASESIYDVNYLRSNLAGGEYYDWYYTDPASRNAQVRTSITDGNGKPWVFRTKDLWSWWSNAHYNRPGGVESANSTAWLPRSKPIWLTELGCPAVDMGSNQPNVFVDPKSSESLLPHFSRGRRDDLMQRRYIEAVLGALDPASDDFQSTLNPVSTVYNDRMFDVSRLFVYTWDARPYPAFPNALDVWSDGENWTLGHWLNGRLGGADLARVIADILNSQDFANFDVSQLQGVVPGFVIDRVMSARQALQPLETAYRFDVVESGGLVKFQHRFGAQPVVEIMGDDLVDNGRGGDLATITRGQDSELPSAVAVGFLNGEDDYQSASASSQRLLGESRRVSVANLPLVLTQEHAENMADAFLHEAWSARERLQTVLPPSATALEPGDRVRLKLQHRTFEMRLTRMTHGLASEVEGRSYGAGASAEVAAGSGSRPSGYATVARFGPTDLIVLDLPLLRGETLAEASRSHVVAIQTPWPSSVPVLSSLDGDAGQVISRLTAPGRVGVLKTASAAGVSGRLSWGSGFELELYAGTLESVTELNFLGGANVAAVKHPSGDWEMIQFRSAELVAPRTYRLSEVLRGQYGTEELSSFELPSETEFVLLDTAVRTLDFDLDDVGRPVTLRYGPADYPLSDPTWQSASVVPGGRALTPLKPVHARGARDHASSDLDVRWIRQTRIGGDSWEALEVPLGEDAERYRVEIRSHDNVVRTFEVAQPEVRYTAAEQIADFGILQPKYDVAIMQVSAVAGPGPALISRLG